MKKNPNLSSEQKLILFEEGTERPGSSELNFEKLVGHRSLTHCLMYLKQKQITMLVTQEPSIIVRVVVGIMDIYLMMVLNQQVKDIVIMVYV